MFSPMWRNVTKVLFGFSFIISFVLSIVIGSMLIADDKLAFGMCVLLGGMFFSIVIHCFMGAQIEMMESIAQLKQERGGNTAPTNTTYPVNTQPNYGNAPATWKCSCGAVNNGDTMYCYHCGGQRK